MTSKLCRTCKSVIPASQYDAHRQAHLNAEKPNPHHSVEWARARRQALRRDGYRCQVCGRTKAQLDAEGTQLHVHHLNESATDNRLENLIVVCEDHHPRGGHRTNLP